MNTFLSRAACLAAVAAALATAALGTLAMAAEPATAPGTLDIARLTTEGKLQKPADLPNWVFLGASLGMGYNPGSFNAAHPGQFQVAMMEPNAYRYFMENGKYAPGSMFLLSFYNSDTQPRSINQNGFTQAGLWNFRASFTESGPDVGEGRKGVGLLTVAKLE
jgi:hypothetical protein